MRPLLLFRHIVSNDSSTDVGCAFCSMLGATAGKRFLVGRRWLHADAMFFGTAKLLRDQLRV